MRESDLQLNELKGYRDDPVYKLFQKSTCMNDFIRKLSQSGFDIKTLGIGAYAVVFSHPNKNYAYKVVTTSDYGYLKFLRYVKSNQDNPHLPKIYGRPLSVKMPLRKKNPWMSGNFLIIKMEKLTPATSKTATPTFEKIDFYVNTFSDFVGGYLTLTDLEYHEQKIMYDIERNWPELADVLQWIAKNQSPNDGVDIDLHNENVMMRGGTLVVTDPFSTS